jgi:anti-sigma factor RsiW
MLQRFPRRRQVTCPAPESLVPYALGEENAVVARHVEGCPTCEAELARLREAAGMLRAERSFQSRSKTPDCLADIAVADFVEGRVTPERRTPVIQHLLTCAYCRSRVQATGRVIAEKTVEQIPRAGSRRRLRWYFPAGIAAAAAAVVLLLVWPRSVEQTDTAPRLREPGVEPEPGPPGIYLTGPMAPVPLSPRTTVPGVDRFVWSSVPRIDRYRLRLYDDEGKLLWSTETADTVLRLPDSIVLSGSGPYFWKVEAETEWGRWSTSDLMEFRLSGSKR